MVSDPNLVLYTCIAHNQTLNSVDSTILAELNAVDSSLQHHAQQCLNCTPPNHTIFSQTFKNKTHTFLLDYPFVYFGIFDPKMIKFDQLDLLGNLKETFKNIINDSVDIKFTSYCLQGELHPIFDKLLSKSLNLDELGSVPCNGVVNDDYVVENDKIGVVSISSSNKGKKFMALPMLNSCKIGKGFKKKRMCSDSVSDSVSNSTSNQVLSDDNVGVSEIKSREIVCENGVCYLNNNGNGNGNGNGNNNSNVGRQKAKKIWRRHVWIVLMLDLAVCLILFGIWLFVCRGFECVEG